MMVGSKGFLSERAASKAGAFRYPRGPAGGQAAGARYSGRMGEV